jgi:hypothetical protein
MTALALIIRPTRHTNPANTSPTTQTRPPRNPTTSLCPDDRKPEKRAPCRQPPTHRQ